MTCWLAQFSTEPCDGVEDLCHLIPKQVIKREVFKMPGTHPGGLDAHLVNKAIWHPAIIVRGCRHHHAMLDVGRTLRIPREALPRSVEIYAEVLGIAWWLDREYGEPVQPLH